MGLMEKVRVGKAVRPPRIVIYGGEGIGKSTWAATIPGVVFIPTESGIDNISCASFPLCLSLRDVINAIDALSMETHSYRGVVIDTATSLERLIHDDLLQTTKCASIEMVGGGYGKGYTMAAEKFRSVLSRLDSLRSEQGMASIVIAHGRAESFADPEGPAYDRWAPRLQCPPLSIQTAGSTAHRPHHHKRSPFGLGLRVPALFCNGKILSNRK